MGMTKMPSGQKPRTEQRCESCSDSLTTCMSPLLGLLFQVVRYNDLLANRSREERDAETASEAGSRRPRGSRPGRGLSRDWSEAPTETTVTTMSALNDDDEESENEDEDELGIDPDPTPRKSQPAPARHPRSSRSRLAQVEEDDGETEDGDDVEGILAPDEEEEEDEDEDESDEDPLQSM